ncbi:MAG: murein biosynthesis integral membrane protein MurJ, partial [Sulfobacillus sp.]
LLYVFFSSLAYLFGAVLNAHHRFVYAALAPSLLSGAAVAVMVFMAHPPIHLVALALLIGSVLQLLLQLLPLLRSALRYLAWPRLGDPAVRHMVRLSVPTFASNSVGSGNVMIDRIFGSTLATGSIAALAFADRVVQVPFGVFGAAVSTALFPRFAEALESKQPGRLVRAFSGGVRLIVLITFPVAALMLFLAPPLIDVLFRHGAFSQQAANLTALCLRAYALALIPYSLNMVMMRVYYSLEKTAELALLGVGMLALNAIGDAILVRLMGAPGIALATVIVEGSFSWLLISRLRPRLPGLDLKALIRAAAPVALAALLAGALAALVSGLFPVASTLQAAVATAAGVVVLVLLFYGFCRGLRVPEARRLKDLRRLLIP